MPQKIDFNKKNPVYDNFLQGKKIKDFVSV